MQYVAAFFVTCGVLGADAPAADQAKKDNGDLRQELLRRTKEDQDYRRQVMALFQKKAAADTDKARQGIEEELQPLIQQGQEIDRKNTAWLKEVVAKHGWPGKSLVGRDGAQAAWLLVQHADLDRDFQKKCLPLVAEAVKQGEAQPTHLAYLTDRVYLAEGKKQVYGTQMRTVDGKTVPAPIEDEANVDKRRKEVGLGTMAEYMKNFPKVIPAAPKKADEPEKKKPEQAALKSADRKQTVPPPPARRV
jgi:hypothetical protein